MSTSVSVIMNVRDGAPYLRQALDSVMAQTFQDWELIIWDDCSTDESAAIVAEYTDKRIRYFLSPEDTKLGRARELAIQQAQSEWLAFLDQDDIWQPRKLEQQVGIIQEDSERLGIVYGRALALFPDASERDYDTVHEYGPLPEGDIFTELFASSCFINMSSAMLRRSALRELPRIPDQFQTICDYYLFTHIATRYRARAVQDVVCHYRIHPDSLCRREHRVVHEEAIALLDSWRGRAEPAALARRRRMHSTVLAFEDMCRPRTVIRGTRRLVTEGSVSYLLTRPFARVFRALRRTLHPISYLEGGTIPQARPAKPGASCQSLTLSVIVVNWKVRDLLRECLRSLYREMRLAADEWELIVVDNNSGDGSSEMVKQEFPGATLIANTENRGFARANNQGFAACRGKYVLLLNPDTVLLDDASGRMLETMQRRNDIGALGCRLLNPDGSYQRWTAGSSPAMSNVTCHYLWLYRVLPARILPRPLFLEVEPAEDTEVGWVSGACVLLRREALGDRLFDDRFFMYGEDMELCTRLTRDGWKVMYTPRARILHYGGRSMAYQSAEVQLSRFRSLRDLFIARNGHTSLRYFDFVVAVGFLMRSLVYTAAAFVLPQKGFQTRAAGCRLLLADAVRALVRGEIRSTADAQALCSDGIKK